MSEYPNDRKFSDTLIPVAKDILEMHLSKIIGPHWLMVSSVEQDTKLAADLIARRALGNDVHIALRVRRPDVKEKYLWDFTERARRASGSWVELHKIIWKGYGDYMLYCHASKCRTTIARYFLINLHHFRSWYNAGYPEMWTKEIPNPDR